MYKESKIVVDIYKIQKICVPSSQYAAVVHKGLTLQTRLSLLDLTLASDVIEPVHTIDVVPIHSMVAISDNKIAVTNKRHVVFYNICDEKLEAFEDGDIDLKEENCVIDHFDQTLFVYIPRHDEIKLLDMNGKVLKTLNISPWGFEQSRNVHISYNPQNKRIYCTHSHCLSSMTLEGELTEKTVYMPWTDDVTVSATGDIYTVGAESVYMISMERAEAIEFGKGYCSTLSTPVCISYGKTQKILCVAFEDYIDIFTAN